MAMDKDIFKQIHAARLEADFLNMVQYQREDAIDIIFHYFPNVKYNSNFDYPVFKLEWWEAYKNENPLFPRQWV